MGVPHGFFTREGGVSPAPYASLNCGRSTGDAPENVDTNIGLASETLGFAPDALRLVSQVHGIDCVEFTAVAPDGAVEADAIWTQTPGLALGIRTADCVPLLLAHPRGAVLAVHAGWRGAEAGVLREALLAIERRGFALAEWVAAFGPHIRACCFGVGQDVAELLDDAGFGITQRSGKPFADLASGLLRQLRELGITNVDDTGGCTSCDVRQFFSHRRDHGVTGRLLSVIQCPSP